MVHFDQTEMFLAATICSHTAANDFEFFYDLGHNDVRVELDMIFDQEQWNLMQQAA